MSHKVLPSVSLVIPTKNAGSVLENLIRGLLAQDYPSIAECIFVDNDSQDETPVLISRFAEAAPYPVHTYICTKGLSASRQFGIEKAQYSYVAFIDADCIPEKNWLSAMMETLLRWRTAKSTFIGVGGSNVAPEGANPTQGTISILKNSFLGSHNSVYGRIFEEELEVDHIATVNAVFLREPLLLDLYDDAFHFSGEDLYMSQRLRKAGYRFVYCPKGTVAHALRSTYKEWVLNMYKYGRGRMLVMQKLPILFLEKPLFCAPIGLTLYLLLLPFVLFLPYATAPLGVYFASISGLSIYLCWKNKSMILLPRLLFFFASTHIAYGIGEIQQLFSCMILQKHETLSS